MKTNITRDIDRQYNYDLEIESSYSRDGLMCAALLNGEQIDMFYGPTAESDARQRLYEAVSWELDNGARANLAAPQVEETTMQAQPTYAELVAAREAAYIAQRDAERELTQLKARLTADIAADPSFKNETSRKAELMDRLYGYDIFIDFDSIGDAYRAALAAIEVYQEAAKDARAKMRHETAQMELLRAAELQLQAAQARHDAQEPTDESPYGNLVAKGSIRMKFDTWDFDAFNRVAEPDDDMPF